LGKQRELSVAQQRLKVLDEESDLAQEAQVLAQRNVEEASAAVLEVRGGG
jgi:hypothetical protein